MRDLQTCWVKTIATLETGAVCYRPHTAPRSRSDGEGAAPRRGPRAAGTATQRPPHLRRGARRHSPRARARPGAEAAGGRQRADREGGRPDTEESAPSPAGPTGPRLPNQRGDDSGPHASCPTGTSGGSLEILAVCTLYGRRPGVLPRLRVAGARGTSARAPGMQVRRAGLGPIGRPRAAPFPGRRVSGGVPVHRRS